VSGKERSAMLMKIQTPASRRKTTQPAPEPWPPAWARLPDTIAEIEAGRDQQRRLFTEALDNSQAGRRARLLGLSGVTRK
jgi:hypothetical protein